MMRPLRPDYVLVTILSLVVAMLGWGAVARAQVVRGVVRDATSGTPVPGVVVALDEAVAVLDTDASLRRASLEYAVLTNERGEFAVRTARPGRFVLSAKRVGLKRFQSAPFALSIGESRSVDIAMSAIDFVATLQQMEVLTDAPCAVRPNESRRVAALWEEARAALTASRIAVRDRLFAASVVRYVRELSPQGLRVLREDRASRQGPAEQPFVSLAAGQLSGKGYAQVDAEGAIVYYAPDAAVLTSDEFLKDHCLSVATGRAADAGLVGLVFEPIEGRQAPEITGTMWMDSTTFALKRVDFRYVRLPRGFDVGEGEARGEVRFTDLPNGHWFVSKWFIRMPQLGRPPRQANLVVDNRPLALIRYREEGGDVTLAGAKNLARSSRLTGRVLDSTGRAPLRGARVRISGTRHETPVGPDGSFLIDSLAAGNYTIVVDHPIYAALGLLAGEQDLEITEASRSVTAIQAPGTETVMDRLCGFRLFEPDRAIVRVVARTNSGAVIPGVWIRLRFDTFDVAPNQRIRAVPTTEEIETDRDGAVTFCHTPARLPVRVELMSPDRRRAVAYEELKIPASSVVIVELRR
jgi:hypothetical protein